MIDSDKPAFSVGADPLPEFRGLTKREYMATAMMAALIARAHPHSLSYEDMCADALSATNILLKGLGGG